MPGDRPENAHFVWLEGPVGERNVFVRFVRVVELDGEPGAEAWLHLFADTRYRLRVNGTFVAAGPARFVTQYPEYDSHDLTGLLRAGRNSIEVEVNFFGASSYQSMPDGKPGFIAWGGKAGEEWATPGEWSGELCGAWREDAPLFSFAQNPVEICDTRRLEAGKPRRLRVLGGEEAPWGVLRPYSGRPVLYRMKTPRRVEVAGPLANSERLVGFMAHDPRAGEGAGERTPLSVGFATWIQSPRKQVVGMSCFWGDLECNGGKLEVNTGTPYGNHGSCSVPLEEGWNLLAGRLEILTEYWAWCLGVPEAAELRLHAKRDASCEHVIAISPTGPMEEIGLPLGTDAGPPADWHLSSGDASLLTPARVMGWDRIARQAVRGLPAGSLTEVAVVEAAAATWCFSFDGEFMGYLDLEVEGPAGTVVDVGYDDWQSEEGGLALYRSNPFTDAADRFILRGGRQRIEGFHPRGGKLVQVTLRAACGRSAPLGVHSVGFRSRQTFSEDGTRFSCDLRALEWSWPVSLRTLAVSTDESFTDCPWRERGCYVADSLVSIHLNALMDGDMRTARRVLRLFAQAGLPGGQLACCAPAWLRKPHEDFTWIWILALHDYWALTGDLSLVREVWPVVNGILCADRDAVPPGGLASGDGKRLFIDWGVLPSERLGEANAVLNLFRLAAYRLSSVLAAALGKEDEAGVWRDQAAAIDKAIMSSLWMESEGRLRAGAGQLTEAVHANVLALAFALGSPGQRERILEYIEPRLHHNFRRGMERGQFGGHVELYFFHYLLPTLAEHGRPDLAEALIEVHYGYLEGLGDDTLPECFCRVEEGVGSRCHSWSGAAAIYAARYVLGLRLEQPGNPDRYICNPVVDGIRRASGRVAHARGWLEVSWENNGGLIQIEVNAPPDVVITSGHPLQRRKSAPRVSILAREQPASGGQS